MNALQIITEGASHTKVSSSQHQNSIFDSLVSNRTIDYIGRAEDEVGLLTLNRMLHPHTIHLLLQVIQMRCVFQSGQITRDKHGHEHI